ncbi:MAG TPA: hypothetical protein VMA34_04435 [Terracidiphilus sp.]|nr:hypothetical protein [Terracidiphilus sp.]
MNTLSNIWKQPRTTAAGLLIAVSTAAGVLSQQGITLGKAGTGTVVALAGALATALLGLLAKDPAGAPARASVPCTACKAGAASRLGVWMLIALLVQLTWTTGCTGKSVAQDIVNWTPSLQSAVATVDATAAQLAPADAAVFTAATQSFDAASNLLVTQAKAYLANPTSSTLALLQNQVVVLQQQVNAALLQAGKIVNTGSQQRALAAVQAVATIVSSILSLVQSVSSQAAVARMAAASGIKLAAVRGSLDGAEAARIVAAHYNEPVSLAARQVTEAEQAQMQAGF